MIVGAENHTVNPSCPVAQTAKLYIGNFSFAGDNGSTGHSMQPNEEQSRKHVLQESSFDSSQDLKGISAKEHNNEADPAGESCLCSMFLHWHVFATVLAIFAFHHPVLTFCMLPASDLCSDGCCLMTPPV